jgi:hypothetical protein
MTKALFIIARDRHDFTINADVIRRHKEFDGARLDYVDGPERLRGATLTQRNVVFCEDWHLRDNAREILEALMLRIDVHPEFKALVGL